MMVDYKLVEKQLKWYEENRKIKLKPVLFTKKLFGSLFEKYKYYGMTESHYCCYGMEQCCWYDPIEEGIWFKTLPQVKETIKDNIKRARKYLYNQKKNSFKYGQRVYMYEDENECRIYIYLRDKLGLDYDLWFSKSE